MPTLRYTLCDVFTDRPLCGNALAVFTGAGDLPTDTLQAVAREMNLSEIVFVYPPKEGGQARLRIFTPKAELPFAGHPVLGAASVIGRSVQTNPVHLETGAGVVTVEVDRQGADVRGGQMTVPLPKVTPWADPEPLLAALGLAQSILPIELYDLGPQHVVLAVDSEAELQALDPDMGRLAKAHSGGITVIARRDAGLAMRVFAPALGVPEDPATGSAAGPVAAHVCRHGWFDFGQTVQIAQGEGLLRPSLLFATAHGSAERLLRVEVGGSVRTIGRGELRIGVV